MKTTHPDIAHKKFKCFMFHLAERIDWLAADCRLNPDTLFSTITEAISTRHQDSVPTTRPNHPIHARYLELETIGIYYQVLPDVVEIAELVCLIGRLPYGQAHSISTDFTK